MLYLARPSLFDGVEVQLGDDPQETFIYDSKKHGYMSWVYDVASKTMRRPCLGRPFANPWHLSLAGTPRGVHAMCQEKLYHADIDAAEGSVVWTMVDPHFPAPREAIDYHYEFQPLLHDTRRDRLIQLKGDENRVDVFVRPFADGATWEQLETTGKAAIGREAVYIPKHDAVLWLADRQLFALDCATRKLGELDVDLPDGLYTHECAMVYDPKHDVCVALIPRSFTGPMQTFLYRYDARTAKYR